jgi:murein DD-endopeptidase MepM/ murein hydrolase activator NlpD
VIAHSGGLDTLYGHLSTALVKVGQAVIQGQPVGLEGSTGNSTGAHLHFELRINQRPVDPMLYLPPGPPSAFKG